MLEAAAQLPRGRCPPGKESIPKSTSTTAICQGGTLQVSPSRSSIASHRFDVHGRIPSKFYFDRSWSLLTHSLLTPAGTNLPNWAHPKPHQDTGGHANVSVLTSYQSTPPYSASSSTTQKRLRQRVVVNRSTTPARLMTPARSMTPAWSMTPARRMTPPPIFDRAH